MSKIALLILASCVFALPLAPNASAGPRVIKPGRAMKIRPRPPSSNKLFAAMSAVNKAWLPLRSTMTRVKGTITVDPAVQSALLGSCSDIVVNAVVAPSYTKVASVKAFGDIGQGRCSYGMFLSPSTKRSSIVGYFAGPSSKHPGDYLEVRDGGGGTFAATAGQTLTRNLTLTYDYIK